MTQAEEVQGGFAGAVQRAQSFTVRVAASHHRTTSGTVLAPDLVVTSSRALREAEQLTVTGEDKVEHQAELVGSDPSSDVALLRIANGGLAVPELRDAASLRVGEFSLALGRPGQNIRASLRIVGLLAHDVRTPHGGKLEHYVETDRGFPDGFAGGPLIDASGALIGMNTPSLIRGADLAVPHVTLARVAQELATHGQVRRGYLGVATQPVRLPAALRQSLQQRSGALVLDTEADGPGHEAGLVLGDVIVALDDEPIRGPRELASALSNKHGVEVSLKLVRAGAVTTLKVTTGQRG